MRYNVSINSVGRSLAFCSAILLCSQTSRAESEPFRVGLILPLSGPVAENGVALRNGVQMAQEAKGGECKNIEIHVEDSHHDPKTAVSAFHKLRLEDKVKLIYSWGSNPSSAVAPVSEAERFPQVVWNSSTDIGKGRKFVMRFNNLGDDFGKVIAEDLARRGKTKLAIIKVDNVYIESILVGIKKALHPNQTLEEITTLQPTDTDARSAVTRVKAGGYDALGVFVYPGQISQVYRQIAQQKLDIATFGTDFFESRTEILASGPAIEGAVYSHNRIDPGFGELYIKKFGNDLQITSAGGGYDFFSLVCGLFNEGAANKTSEEIVQAILSSGSHVGIEGAYQFRSTPEAGVFADFPIVLKKITGGNIQVVQ